MITLDGVRKSGFVTIDGEVVAIPSAHAASHTDGTDDIRDATASQKGLATADQITKLDSLQFSLNYWLSNAVLDLDLTDSESAILETPSSTPETLASITFKSIVAETPTPFTVLAGQVVDIHFKADITAGAGRTLALHFVFGYVDSDGTSNFVQIGAASDATAGLTTSKTAYELHIHVAADTTVPAGKRLWLKVVSTSIAGGGGYPEINFYYDSPSHHIIIPTAGDVLGNFVQKALFDANTILKADSADTPVALPVAVQRIVGRITAGVITDLTATEVRTLINVADGADVTGANPPQAHAASHQNGGGDEISVAGLSGELADDQPPKDHAAAHQNGGGDEISVAGLSGELADDQPPKAHAASHMSAGGDPVRIDELKAPTDVTTLDVSTSLHGLTPKAPNDATKFLRGDATWAVPGGSSGTCKDYLSSGLLLSRDADTDHDINVTAGLARDAANAADLNLASEMTKRIDATWVAGDDNGGRSSSVALANNTWYHMHLIIVGGSVDLGFDTSITAANLVADHSATAYRLIGSVLTDGSANIIAFTNPIPGWFYWTAAIHDVDDSGVDTGSREVFQISTPEGRKTKAILYYRCYYSGGRGRVYVSSLDQGDQAPSDSGPVSIAGQASAAVAQSGPHEIWTSTTRQVGARAMDSNTEFDIYTAGWYDPRGLN